MLSNQVKRTLLIKRAWIAMGLDCAADALQADAHVAHLVAVDKALERLESGRCGACTQCPRNHNCQLLLARPEDALQDCCPLHEALSPLGPTQ
jgi:hypothetical protein